MLKNKLQLNLNSLADTEKLASIFTEVLDPGLMICLYGPIGTGKTTFVQYVCKNLDVQEQVTSPSFVILNEYYSGKFPVYHFDLYRLEEEGVNTILSELEEYSSDSAAVTFVEWAEFSKGDLLEDRLEINFSYDEEFSTRRFVSIKSRGINSAAFLERLNEEIADNKF